MIKLNIHIDDESVRLALKSKLKPWLKKQWCIGQIGGEYLAKMENVLSVYERPIQNRRNRLCFDERPCRLLEEVLTALPTLPGKAAKEDNDGGARALYSKGDVCGFVGI